MQGSRPLAAEEPTHPCMTGKRRRPSETKREVTKARSALYKGRFIRVSRGSHKAKARGVPLSEDSGAGEAGVSRTELPGWVQPHWAGRFSPRQPGGPWRGHQATRAGQVCRVCPGSTVPGDPSPRPCEHSGGMDARVGVRSPSQ